MNNSSNLGDRIAGAAKWSALTQVASKLISPVTTMVLARLLAPAAFGVVASATMVTSLADMFSDAGFQKYLVQHRFKDGDELSLSACVAFWTNLAISIVVVFFVAIARDSLAELVGSAGWGMLLVVASLSLPLTSLSSVQTAFFQRDYDFKTLFSSRVGSSLLILLVSVPLAAVGMGPWSMVIGTLASNLFLAVWLTVQSPWKPGLRYDARVLRKMLSYGIWILAEAAGTWVNTWAGTFVIGQLMDQTHVGYFKTSTTMSAGIIGVVSSAVLPVVFVALSEVQEDRGRFESLFLKLQGYLGFAVVPMALGILVYHDAVTQLLLGNQWSETALFFGLWTGTSCLVVVLGFMCSEAYRALGRPHWCAFVQAVYLIPFLPALWLSASSGYSTVTWVMPLARLSMLAIQLPVLRHVASISHAAMIGNLKWVFLASFVAMIPGVFVTIYTDSLIAAIVAAACSVVVYVAFALRQPSLRAMLDGLTTRLGISITV